MSFGYDNPKEMPPHFFSDAIEVDFSTAVRANILIQDYSVSPRHWYIDARFHCRSCGSEFLWSAQEQKTWFESYRFWVDSFPTLCRRCRGERRNALQLRQEYDSLVADAKTHGAWQQKQRIVEIVDVLEDYFGSVPSKIAETRSLFRQQLAKRKPTE